MAHGATTMNENGIGRQYVCRGGGPEVFGLTGAESLRMSLTRDALWHNGL